MTSACRTGHGRWPRPKTLTDTFTSTAELSPRRGKCTHRGDGNNFGSGFQWLAVYGRIPGSLAPNQHVVGPIHGHPREDGHVLGLLAFGRARRGRIYVSC